jgi:hypothetical protein
MGQMHTKKMERGQAVREFFSIVLESKLQLVFGNRLKPELQQHAEKTNWKGNGGEFFRQCGIMADKFLKFAIFQDSLLR